MYPAYARGLHDAETVDEDGTTALASGVLRTLLMTMTNRAPCCNGWLLMNSVHGQCDLPSLHPARLPHFRFCIMYLQLYLKT
jgi:hypothetical protein